MSFLRRCLSSLRNMVEQIIAQSDLFITYIFGHGITMSSKHKQGQFLDINPVLPSKNVSAALDFYIAKTWFFTTPQR